MADIFSWGCGPVGAASKNVVLRAIWQVLSHAPLRTLPEMWLP